MKTKYYQSNKYLVFTLSDPGLPSDFYLGAKVEASYMFQKNFKLKYISSTQLDNKIVWGIRETGYYMFYAFAKREVKPDHNKDDLKQQYFYYFDAETVTCKEVSRQEVKDNVPMM